MKKRQIIEWALKHGFLPVGGNTYEAPYENMRVRIVLGHKFFSSFLMRGVQAEVLVKTSAELIELGPDGMIHGAGLESRFLNRMHYGGSVPCWFPQGHAANLLPDRVTVGRSTTRGLSRDDVIEWALENGFHQINRSLLQCFVGEDLVTLRLFANTVQAYISGDDGDKLLGASKYERLSIDEDGVIRGLGLRDRFIDNVMSGGSQPPWLSPDHVDTHMDALQGAKFG